MVGGRERESERRAEHRRSRREKGGGGQKPKRFIMGGRNGEEMNKKQVGGFTCGWNYLEAEEVGIVMPWRMIAADPYFKYNKREGPVGNYI